MNDYPLCVPAGFIKLYQSGVLFENQMKIAEKLIFDNRMELAWSALGKRASQFGVDVIFFQLLIIEIDELSKGPANWELLTQRERKSKVGKIASLAYSLAKEIEDTPFDEMLTEYINHKFCVDNALERALSEPAKKRFLWHVGEFCYLESQEYHSKEKSLGMSSAWASAGITAPPIYNMLIGLHEKAINFVDKPVIKRKLNPQKNHFVKKLSGFFLSHFGLKLHEITSTISSVFLDEDVTVDDVVSITKER